MDSSVQCSCDTSKNILLHWSLNISSWGAQGPPNSVKRQSNCTSSYMQKILHATGILLVLDSE